MKPTVSVIIPVYNHAHTLEDCLGTIVWGAEYCDMQVIIVNDGSTDNFHEALEKVLNKYPAVKDLNPKVIDQPNLGAAAARNRGFKEATGEYVIFVDADTFCYPHMFAEMIERLSAHPDVSYVYSQFRFGWKKMRSRKFDAGALKINNYIDTTSLIRTKDFPGFDESLKRFQDWDLWLTMLEQEKVGIFINTVLYKKIISGRQGMSSWLPSFMYKLPWKSEKVKEYEAAKEIVMKKHGLI